tara:strand:+ start:797 stop:1237 length:441 start_codon:yes stop_codon:yes gene_type:complete
MAKKFKVHNMYSKTGIKRVAKTEAEHNALKRRGYGHTPVKKTAKKSKVSPLAKKGDAPSRKKSKGNYAEVKKGGGTGKKAGGGMTAKGVAKYRKDNPGSKLKTAVTTPPSKLKKGSKAAGRRKSFCARSKSWKSERGLAARRKWNC